MRILSLFQRTTVALALVALPLPTLAAQTDAGAPPAGLTIGDILSHTPVWVWALLVVLVAMGSRSARDRTLGTGGYVIFPSIMVLLAIYSLTALSLEPLTVVGFIGGAAIGALAGFQAERRLPSVAAGDGQLRLKADWIPLVTVLAVFLTRYVTNVAFAIDVPLATNPWFQFAVAGISALFGAMLLVRMGLRIRVAYGAGAPIADRSGTQ